MGKCWRDKRRMWAEIISLYPCEICIIFTDVNHSCYIVALIRSWNGVFGVGEKMQK